MDLDRYDLLTVSFGSAGLLFGSFVGFALEAENTLLFQVLGVVAGVSFVIFAVESSL